MTDLISTHNLSKQFGENIAVDNLTLSIPAGEIFGLLGPNGAGKTTTLRMLTALIAPTGGEAYVAGYQVGQDDTALRKNVGILTESPGLYDRLSAERNLDFFARLYEVEDIPGQIERYLRMLGLWERRWEPVGQFSRGMRQKVAIARALLHEPPVLLLDEPTSGLDPESARTTRQFISGLRDEGRAILICTHNLDEADRLCDRIAIFKSTLLALDTPTALRRQLYGRSVEFHLSKAEARFAKALEEKEFVHSVEISDNKLVVSLDDPESHNPMLARTLVELGAEIQFV
ncbi:MAG: ABC transporter ATP-binding protein, partial [Chloroflexi bacterium]|nr:ABC transporter ATP-binding protein [Chloroflexota bacterium]